MPLQSAKTSAVDPVPATDPATWIKTLNEDFTDSTRTNGFLELAEAAERACPANGIILIYAATAAVLERKPDKARFYLKRFSKRFVEKETYYLLSALTLGAQKKQFAAKALLERHGLTDWRDASRYFPGGWERRGWLAERIDAIMGRAPPVRASKTAPVAAAPRGRASLKAAAPFAPAPLPPAIPTLERLQIDIPLAVNSDRTPFLTTMQVKPRARGGWFALRERLARLGLAESFDELLCVPHLKGIQIFWYQTETVRKVLKQFHGRVLLADEVGLGKTVEAGMVLKEYLLRGMVERVLILVPASLVGQWREELETKFDISCITTHDPLVREDPERFWASPRIIASLALARRREHAERLVAQPFDLVIVDEAHHLRDRASQSYKLVDDLTKRFLLLLSATPVQNNLIELYNLLTLLKPGIFKTQKEFRAAYMIAGKPRQPANSERLRDLMRDAMIRNTRAVVALKLPRRHASTRHVEPTAAEQAAYQDLAAKVRALVADDPQNRQRLTAHHLLGAAGSSPAAASAAISRFAARHGDDPSWGALAKRWAALGDGGKELALLELLTRNRDEKKLVFIQYRETISSLAKLLSRNGVDFACFEGGLSGPDKMRRSPISVTAFPCCSAPNRVAKAATSSSAIRSSTSTSHGIRWRSNNALAVSTGSVRVARYLYSIWSRTEPSRSRCCGCWTKRSTCSSWSSARSGRSWVNWRKRETSQIWCWMPGWRRRHLVGRRRSMRSAVGSTRRAVSMATPRRSTRPCLAKSSIRFSATGFER